MSKILRSSFLLLTCIFDVCFLSFNLSHADSSSTNYKLESEAINAGGSFQITSANYKIEEGSIDWIAKSSLSSANFAAEGRTGIEGASGLPVISGIAPGDLAEYFTDESTSFTVTVSDPDSDTPDYQAKQDGTLKDGPQASNNLTWALVNGDRGRRSVELIVNDADGAVSKTQSMYAYRRPVK